ncbi:hypothetical protein C343_04909 [Cryptococcus neoformans C23]|uniref:Uncharacterized protein n=2 Tax=Cryptococcus neoformans TaxID=5207 RepID=A0A854Q7Y5_CRYNE|nr:hypothetical protein CNAG_03558 [Cryptococcus neoformans var. grubii H99]AUB26741.1 hypothetical protein CKF44_03558 [Cryptococcus neoformans var. grubii]OWZ29873.1 hypothetical protein C347_04955 [Cryptococcus neoformans var. grubii AD2-60a]OWZ36825.1 hypothetical protein C353_04805 [Cryptococcus neoformans var. grubii AD1-83a]OWZ41747.1 hypothetical protein C343_04909 [Cryptococcus neoformans var. grubii C23]OWZ52750.1 hypothetical protein C368_04980 [Cryptococcus neoformans var. grubii 1|eukprot:XP_012051001.1 hypothetical protein CNAG_03558 [Cryptococcus neoformans var. grubii H99]
MAFTTTEAVVTYLFARPTLPPLEPGSVVYDRNLVKSIEGLDVHKYVKAALHLVNDDINRCHLIAQDHEGDPTADLLHATLHRREGDYWNSKYWYSHVRSHPLVPDPSDAKAFVDACAKAKPGNDAKMRERQWSELKRLVEWTLENCH